GKVIGDHDIAQNSNAVAGEDGVDRVRLFAEAERSAPQIACPRISRAGHFRPSRPIRGTLIVCEPVEMDEGQTCEIAGNDSFPVSIWTEPAADQANISWAREMYAALRPFAMDGVYVNNLGDEGDDRLKAAYGENYTRLVELKRRYDPDNMFRLNQNIRPAA